MSKNERQKEQRELKEARLRADAEEHAKERRSNLFKMAGGAILVAIIVIGVLIVVSQSGSDTKKQDAKLAGIPQNGLVLGKPGAPITVVEFGDLQCPFCKQFSETVTPAVIDGPVRKGKANMEFQNFVIIGPDSVAAAYAAYAAAEQNRYWDFIEAFYAEQGTENTGYVTDGFLTKIANDAGVPDMAKWEKDRKDTSRWDKQIKKTQTQAAALGFQGTPSFAIRKGNGALKAIQVEKSQDLLDAINQAGK